MPRPCTVCIHSDRDAIDLALVNGMAYRAIAQRFAASPDAVLRHKRDHLAETMAKAIEAAEVVEAARGGTLLDQIKDLQETTLRVLGKAEQAGKFVPAIMAIREARGNLELLAKMVGELDERPVVNIATNPQWLTIQAVIMDELATVPDVRVRLATKLAELAG